MSSPISYATDGLSFLLLSLFLASMVSERIVEFTKMHFPALWLKSFYPEDELKRHRNIRLLAILPALMAAVLMDVRPLILLQELSVDFSLKGIGELLKKLPNGFKQLFGYFLAALLISLGSKFWHDLLDLVVFIKNGKRQIRNAQMPATEGTEQQRNFLKQESHQLAEQTLEANRSDLQKQFPLASFSLIHQPHPTHPRWCVLIIDRPKDKDSYGNPPSSNQRISMTTAYGYIFHLPLIYQKGGVLTTSNGDATAVAGGGIYHVSNRQNMGTFGCLVTKRQSNAHYLLTCYHCVKPQNGSSWRKFIPGVQDAQINYVNHQGQEHAVGELYMGYRNAHMDVALVKANDPDKVTDYQWSTVRSIPQAARAVTASDVERKTKLWFVGSTSGTSSGYILNRGFSGSIDYRDGNPSHRLYDLIVFSKNRYAPFEKPCDLGDSGSIILDAESKEALGMIVAVDDHFGYAIPMTDILAANELSLSHQNSIFPT